MVEERPLPFTRAHRMWVAESTLCMVLQSDPLPTADTAVQGYTIPDIAKRNLAYAPLQLVESTVAALLPPGPCRQVLVTLKDPLYAAADCMADLYGDVAACPASPQVAVLDMACEVRPGGGFLEGALGAEEALCCRTDLYPKLAAAAQGRTEHGHRSHYKAYPLPSISVLVTSVTVMRSAGLHQGANRGPGFRFLAPQRRFPVGVLVSAAAHRPPVSKDPTTGLMRYDFGVDIDRMYYKMLFLLASAAKHGFHTLILGAWGCGACGHPPRSVAHLFKRALDAHGAAFHRVVFAIPDPELAAVFAHQFTST